MLDVNLKGPFLCSAVAAACMRERHWGRIINIASIAVAGVSSGPLAYAAAKAGLIGLSKLNAHELGPHGITVNVIAPGVTRTEWVQKHMSPESLEAVAERNLLRRVGEPEDIAGVVAFLASDDAAYITGCVLSVSGGAWMP